MLFLPLAFPPLLDVRFDGLTKVFNGGDLTDNKLLILWVLWVVAVLVVGFKPKKKEGPARFVVAVCAIVAMTVVYLIPHSMRGSELDYSKLEGVENPKDAIGTGKK